MRRHTMRRAGIAALCLACAASPCLAGPVGSLFQVNGYTTGTQDSPVAGADASGNVTRKGDPNAGPPLGEIIVPEINAPDARPVRVAARASWQLRVHPPQEGFAPFELSRPDEEPTGIRLDKAALRAELARLHSEGTGKPLLAPHADSRSEDMLEALSALEAEWSGSRRAAVAPQVAVR